MSRKKNKNIDKKGKDKDSKKLSGDEIQKRGKRSKKPSEGSRFGALVLFGVSILVSLAFYIYGIWSQKGVSIDFSFGEMESTWEYSK